MKAKAMLTAWLCCAAVAPCHAGARAQGGAKSSTPQRPETARTTRGPADAPPRVMNLTPKQLEAIRSRPLDRLRNARLNEYAPGDKEIYGEVVNKLGEVLAQTTEHKVKDGGYDLAGEIMGYLNPGVSVREGAVTLSGTIFVTRPGVSEHTHVFGDALVREIRRLPGVKRVDWKMKYETYDYSHPGGSDTAN